jgi:hypothetical protein
MSSSLTAFFPYPRGIGGIRLGKPVTFLRIWEL